jgi:putative ABC transport system permease protein
VLSYVNVFQPLAWQAHFAMSSLDIKLLRDFKRLWAQALAIALVIAGGVAALVLAVGAFRSLDETRTAYYERHRFADVFANVRRAPNTLVERIAEIPGVAAVETRIAKLALLDIPDLSEPATGQFVSLPQSGGPTLNQLYLRIGRTPEPGKAGEVVVNESFAEAHTFRPGSRFSAILNGRKRPLVIVGIALSPEFVYAIGPGDIMPDDRRFGIIWMSERALASIYDLEGAFSSVSLKLLPDASEREVIRRLDALLDRYGGLAAYSRKDQTSHAFLNHSLDMLGNMSRTLPPIFLLVAAFLVNLTLTRLVALEREQIGLLKALGYGNVAIAGHYLKLVIVIAAIGIVIGAAAGTGLGSYVTRLYGDYFRFPFLVFLRSPDLYLVAGLLSVAAAVAGTARALREIVCLAPAVAMQPPAPARFRRLLPATVPVRSVLSQPTVMMLRSLGRHPMRAALTMLGMAASTGILVVSLYIDDSMETLIDLKYFRAERQDATVSFVDKRPGSAVFEMKRVPGVLAVEPSREVPVRIRREHVERRVMLSGRTPDADLRRIIDVNARPFELPQQGVALSDWLAGMLNVDVGDMVEIDLLEGRQRALSLPVAARMEDFFGISAVMDGNALARLMYEAPAVDSVHLSVDENRLDALYAALKGMPTVSGIALQRVSLANFREAVVVIVATMAGIYVGLAAIIAFGVVYNSARIALSERARELASLRVLGFTQNEVFRILLLELALLSLLAQPPGWAIGYVLSWRLKNVMDSDVMRSPLIVENSSYALASAIVIGAAILSALIVRQRIGRLDLVAVLKTRD